MLPPITRGQVLMRLTRFDGKSVELDPGYVILVEPPLVGDEDVTEVCLEGGARVRLKGGHEQNAAAIQTARSLASEIMLETLIESIRASVTPVPVTEVN